MSIFFITDNIKWLQKLLLWRNKAEFPIEIFCSPKGTKIFEQEIELGYIKPLDVKKSVHFLVANFDIGISCHCKQIFPKELVENLRCYNIHPGLNPFNRGWFPQVFSIVNKLPSGATIHRMDAEVDHGAIVAQKEVRINEWENSSDIYAKILAEEFELFEQHIESIIDGRCLELPIEEEGNYNSVNDFKEMCALDLDEKVTFRQAIDRLRALTFDEYNNAFFKTKEGKKVFVSLNMRLDEDLN